LRFSIEKSSENAEFLGWSELNILVWKLRSTGNDPEDYASQIRMSPQRHERSRISRLPASGAKRTRLRGSWLSEVASLPKLHEEVL